LGLFESLRRGSRMTCRNAIRGQVSKVKVRLADQHKKL
jgi:hypothetical protein